MSSPIPGGGRERQQIQKEWSSLQTDNFKLMGNYKNTSDVERKLLARFPHFYPAVKRVLDDIRSTPAHRPWVRFRPLLIVGPPGIGKTIFVETLADLLGIPFEKIDVTGMTDNRLLAGTASGWATAQPCFPVFAMRQRDCANPMILIDGIDRSSGSSKNGDVRRTLEAMTDRRSASTYRDECLLAPVDLSAINWIACANSEDELRGGLLGRFGVVKIDSPTSIHYGRISSSIRTLIEEENELQPGTLPELDQSIEEKLKKQFGKSITPRMLAGIFRKILLTPELFPPPQLH
jgi:ATP-dependent Lon protease